MTAFELYHSELNVLQTPKNDSSKDTEVDNRLKKIHFADLVKDAKSVFLLLA